MRACLPTASALRPTRHTHRGVRIQRVRRSSAPACAGSTSPSATSEAPAGVVKSTSWSPRQVDRRRGVPEVDHDRHRTALHHQGARVLVDVHVDPAHVRVGELGRARGAARPAGGRPRAAPRGGPCRARPSRAWSARTSPGPAGRARPRGPSPSARTPRSGPRRSPVPSSGSGCEVKNWNGVDAAHSSPWKSIGVNGPGQGQQRRAGELVVVERLGDPVAAGAVADLVVVLAADHQPPGRHRARCRSARRGRGRGTTRTCRRGRSPLAAPSPAPTAARSRRSSRRSRRSAPRARRGGSRRSTARRARSRRPRAG